MDADNIQTTLNEAITQAYDQIVRTTPIDNAKLDANEIDCDTSYKDTPIPIHLHTRTSILQTNAHNRKWNPKDFVYTDGSQMKGNPALGARVPTPNTLITTHVDIKSQPQRHKINKAEQTAIAVAHGRENKEDRLSILTDSSFVLHQHNQKLHNRPNVLQPPPTQRHTPSHRSTIENKGLKTTPNTHRQG